MNSRTRVHEIIEAEGIPLSDHGVCLEWILQSPAIWVFPQTMHFINLAFRAKKSGNYRIFLSRRREKGKSGKKAKNMTTCQPA